MLIRKDNRGDKHIAVRDRFVQRCSVHCRRICYSSDWVGVQTDSADRSIYRLWNGAIRVEVGGVGGA